MPESNSRPSSSRPPTSLESLAKILRYVLGGPVLGDWNRVAQVCVLMAVPATLAVVVVTTVNSHDELRVTLLSGFGWAGMALLALGLLRRFIRQCRAVATKFSTLQHRDAMSHRARNVSRESSTQIRNRSSNEPSPTDEGALPEARGPSVHTQTEDGALGDPSHGLRKGATKKVGRSG
jgi:hypothetical protein